MKNFLLVVGFIIMLCGSLSAAERNVLVNGSGEELGTASNPIKISLTGGGGSGEWTDQGAYLEPNEPLADSVSIGQDLTVWGVIHAEGGLAGGNLTVSETLWAGNNLVADSTGIEGNNLQPNSVLDAALSASVSTLVNDAGYIAETDSNLNFTNDLTVSADIFTESQTLSQSGTYTAKGSDLFGGIIYADQNVSLSGVSDGMRLSVIVNGPVTVSVDPDNADKIWLDGVPLDDGDKITSTGSSGDIAVLTYYSADGWYASTNSWTDGGA